MWINNDSGFMWYLLAICAFGGFISFIIWVIKSIIWLFNHIQIV